MSDRSFVVRSSRGYIIFQIMRNGKPGKIENYTSDEIEASQLLYYEASEIAAVLKRSDATIQVEPSGQVKWLESGDYTVLFRFQESNRAFLEKTPTTEAIVDLSPKKRGQQ